MLRNLQPFDLDSEENPSFIAWNRYPGVTPEEREAFRKNHNGKLPPRLHAHADMDVLTILFQRVGDVGLEIAPGNEVRGRRGPRACRHWVRCWCCVHAC